MTILFINGVNTAYGGSGKASLISWLNSFLKLDVKFELLNSVPTFGLSKKGYLLYFLLALYFFPGVIFRFLRIPIFEFLYKVSPFLLLYILYFHTVKKYKFIIFSHYSVFLYFWIFNNNKRIFIIQDLLYIRAKSKGYSRKLCKLIFKFECLLYNRAPNVICLSYQESKILSKFLASSIHLASCIDNKINDSPPCYENILDRVAIVSDWRRIENMHGLIHFFQKSSDSDSLQNIEYWIYGISSHNAVKLVKGSFGSLQRIKFYDGGTFVHYDDIPTKYFLVPIYMGAGIKLKTLEMFSNGRYVFGTPGAFIGIPRFLINEFSKVVFSPSDIILNSSLDSLQIRNSFCKSLFHFFEPIGSIVRNIHE